MKAGLVPLLIGFALSASICVEGADTPAYETGYRTIMKLGSDLYRALPPKYREQVHVQPVSLETDVMPFVRPIEYPDETRPLRMVFISVGFVDLMNNVAHAKAINKVEKGYFEKYLINLAQESGEMSLKEIPRISEKRFWSDQMINEQLSNFNQMVGMVLAIELSHHYLGHYRKYADQLSDAKGKPVPINSLLSQAEWDESLKAGSHNALECGLGVQGLKALYEAMDKMPRRPAWTIYFIPESVRVDKVKKTLEQYENDYFHGR